MNPRLIPILIAAASFFLAGCLPESKNPLSTPATSRVDSRLGGVFVERKGQLHKDTAYWHFHYRGASPGADKKARITTTIEILGVAHESNLNIARYRAFAARLDGRDYLSFIEVGADGVDQKGKNYNFARYAVNWRGDLQLWLLDNEAVAATIKSGKLRGTVRSGQWTTDVVITDTTAHLAAFVAASDPVKLFSNKPLVLRRVAR